MLALGALWRVVKKSLVLLKVKGKPIHTFAYLWYLENVHLLKRGCKLLVTLWFQLFQFK